MDRLVLKREDGGGCSESQSSESASEHGGESGFVSPVHQQANNNNGSNSSKLSTNGREARNRAEKNRRDKLNTSIQELATIVPHVADSPRRVDKTAVLRLAAHGFRLNHVFKNSMDERGRSSIADAVLQMVNGFMLTVSCGGQIVLVSSSLEQHLGHCQTDWYGQNILTYTHPDDHKFLREQLAPTNLETLLDIQTGMDSSGEQRPRTREEEEMIDRKLREDRRDITIRMARAGPRSEPTVYEIVRFTGSFRRADLAPRGTKVTYPGLHMIRRARAREESFLPLHSVSGNDIVLVCVGLIVRPPKICDRLLEACKTEYKTRHLIDGRIVQCEQAISIVAGYMTDEVTGLSPFAFMHKDEVRWVMVALRQMYDYNKPFGESCYRLMSRTGKFIYLKTRGYLEIDKATNKVHSFVCINTLVSEEDGKKMVSEMKRKFSIIIDPNAIPQSDSEEMPVENPFQIERAIMNLITNLESSGGGSNGLPTVSESRSDVASRAIAAANGGSADSAFRGASSPPLAIIAPKPCTIKPSVTKTMEVIRVTRSGQRSEEDEEDDDDDDDESGEAAASSGRGVIEKLSSYAPMSRAASYAHQRNSNRPSVVHRTTSNKSMNLDNCFTSSSSSSSSISRRTSATTGVPLIIKPEQQDQITDADGVLVLQSPPNYHPASDGMGVGTAAIAAATATGSSSDSGRGEYSQYLRIKQETSPGDPLYSPASSTVSSLSYDHPGSSSSSTVIAGTGSSRHNSSVVVKRRGQGDADESMAKRRRRRNSRSLDDIPDLDQHPSGFDVPSLDADSPGADIPSYFDGIDQSFDRMDPDSRELRDQFSITGRDMACDNLEMVSRTEELTRIVEEKIEQRELLYSIKQEEFEGRYAQGNGGGGSGENMATLELYLSDVAEEEDNTTGTNNLMPD